MLPVKGTEQETGILPVFGTDVGHDVLIEELEDEWDTVSKHQVLGDNLELRGKKRRQSGIICLHSGGEKKQQLQIQLFILTE